MKGKSLWNKEGMTFYMTAEKNWMMVYDDDNLRELLYAGREKWLEENGKKLRIGDGSNKTFHSIMAAWDNDETYDRKVAPKRKSGHSLMRRRAATRMMVTILIDVVEGCVAIGET